MVGSVRIGLSSFFKQRNALKMMKEEEEETSNVNHNDTIEEIDYLPCPNTQTIFKVSFLTFQLSNVV